MKAMRLTLIASAIAAVAAPAFAAPALEVYGKINITVQATEIENGTNSNDGSTKYDKDAFETKSNASRFGVKGELAISDETAAFYQMEWEIDTTDNSASSKDHIKSRNQGVGLRGGFGQVLAGRWDTPFKLAQNKIDLFNDLDGDLKAIFGGETRANNIVSYSTPSMGGFKINAATLMQEKTDADKASSSDNDQDGLFDATSISVEWSNKDLYVALAMDSDHDTGTYNDGFTATRLVGQYTLSDWQFGLMWQQIDESSTVNTNGDKDAEGADIFDKYDGLLASIAWKVSENGTLKLQHGNSDTKHLGGEQTSFGYDHKLAKNVMVFAFVTDETRDEENKDRSYIGGGLEVKF